MTTRGKFLPDDDEKILSTPRMARSRNQLASAYAPGAFFTFEGGLGACIALPDLSSSVDEASLDDETKTQILLRLKEIWQSWFSRAYQLNNSKRVIDPRLCIDEALLKGSSVAQLGSHQLTFVNPLKIGYAPAPLTFVCNTCHRFKRFESAAELSKNIDFFKKSSCSSSDKKGQCQWRQLDVIFVHWSGEWMPATPGMWEWSDKDGEPRRFGEYCTVCGSQHFELHTESPRIGEWYFKCANTSCGDRKRTWLQNDKFTTEIFKDQAGRRIGERRMEPISYRASSVFYPQSEQFVLFAKKDQKLLSLLEEERFADLANFIAQKFCYGGVQPTPEEMRDILLATGHGKEWESYENLENMRVFAEKMNDESVLTNIDKEQRKLLDRWTSADPPLVPIKAELPATILGLIATRSEFSSRYDPFVLAVEHEALYRSKLSSPPEAGRSSYVRFNHLDNDLAPKDEAIKDAQEAKTGDLMTKLGLVELGLIREFELCRFTHGYTRVSPVPTMEKRGIQVPVRLRLFDPLRSGKRPIYVVTQENEALYVQLDASMVYRWLEYVGTVDLPKWDPDSEVLLGGKLLEIAQPFGRYFSQLKEEDASSYRYVYTLLHTYAHMFMKNISELSGLDLGSLGEYLFPADLAFVIYRNGTTMDLGHLSSLWRNENNRFMARMLEASSHRCNSGSLCDFGGGACPDCIMVPETSCIAQNRLLSRAVLKGGVAPREDATHKHKRIPGFLEVVNAATGS
ncbi:hypothetical protein [Nitrosomonas sp.]|uniref:hypothetical protein n=1 Tax=Nitrosomonas sp. TaxID=42353 RepID=UPI00284E1361|nr:hypothetical protein [Nitrosomonas sp.]MDR4513632.1 hypothetical protein [Nitrosomonas sp.]